jgi:hypothetical protein
MESQTTYEDIHKYFVYEILYITLELCKHCICGICSKGGALEVDLVHMPHAYTYFNQYLFMVYDILISV